jgi:hypothetical protein
VPLGAAAIAGIAALGGSYLGGYMAAQAQLDQFQREQQIRATDLRRSIYVQVATVCTRTESHLADLIRASERGDLQEQNRLAFALRDDVKELGRLSGILVIDGSQEAITGLSHALAALEEALPIDLGLPSVSLQEVLTEALQQFSTAVSVLLIELRQEVGTTPTD